jgi:AraC-like DNA-binding protein
LWRRLLLGLQRIHPHPGLAVRLGRRVPLLAHGPVGYLLATARTLRQALEGLARFAPLRLAVLDVQLHEGKRGMELCAHPRVALGDVECFTLDFLWAMVCSMLEDLSPGACRVATLRLPNLDADTTATWRERGVRVERGVGPMLLLPHALADTVLPTGSAREHQLAWQACEEAERQQGWTGSTTARVQQLFRVGSSQHYQLESVAAELGVSRRTVMRRLAAEGTSFAALVDASRRQRLLRRLAEPQTTLSAIAEDLGYADGSALGRAVQRWFGMGARALQREIRTRGLAALG